MTFVIVRGDGFPKHMKQKSVKYGKDSKSGMGA